MTKSTEDGWFEITEQDGLPRQPVKKLRLLADVNVQAPLVEELRSAGIDVEHGAEKLHGRDDVDVIREARRTGRVLLTFDEDFWDDRKHPVHQSPGVIILAIRPGDANSALEAFVLVHTCFADRSSTLTSNDTSVTSRSDNPMPLPS